jgi:hypothetical protein
MTALMSGRGTEYLIVDRHPKLTVLANDFASSRKTC